MGFTTSAVLSHTRCKNSLMPHCTAAEQRNCTPLLHAYCTEPMHMYCVRIPYCQHSCSSRLYATHSNTVASPCQPWITGAVRWGPALALLCAGPAQCAFGQARGACEGAQGPIGWGRGAVHAGPQARLAAPSLSLREGRYYAFPVVPPLCCSCVPDFSTHPIPLLYSTFPSTLATGHASRAAPVAACGASSLCANHSSPLSFLRPLCPLPHFPPPPPSPAPPPPPFPHFSRSTTHVCAGGSPSPPPRSHPPHSDIGFG